MMGTVINVVAIITGSVIGLLIKGKLPDKIQKTVMDGLGLAVILIGLQMALETKNILIVIFSLVIGGVTGGVINLEEGLNKLAVSLEKKYAKSGDGLFVQGFIQASLVFCVGPIAIMGAIQDGINGDPTILINKAILDGISSIAFSATFGLGVIFSAVAVLIYQGGITLLATWAQGFLVSTIITEMTATGGLIILAIGLNILKITDIKVGNLLPSILVAILLARIFLV
ncbi:DUF554 domain-containing protein [Halothermothrix orenii]|uniref:Uncharacterized membrane protein, possible Na+ channel or pump n=1 Tax=Halothermothrix orenii (strain H 168 / OCM 544 / DSM 9562) TaxID=373903 RepID=B8D1E3_HALOH|nr:DUF554 domain-containing protein [Halothermothrix orenii]ACL71095.1 uncharacterized membrane protein, possible Na+ channel or pump [Halothermothrix orenii H 168]